MGLYRVFRTKKEFTSWFHGLEHAVRQQTIDSMILALHETIKPSESDFAAILAKFLEAWNEIVSITENDFKDDKELAWSTSKIDKALKEALGEQLFVPWEKRY